MKLFPSKSSSQRKSQIQVSKTTRFKTALKSPQLQETNQYQDDANENKKYSQKKLKVTSNSLQLNKQRQLLQKKIVQTVLNRVKPTSVQVLKREHKNSKARLVYEKGNRCKQCLMIVRQEGSEKQQEVGQDQLLSESWFQESQKLEGMKIQQLEKDEKKSPKKSNSSRTLSRVRSGSKRDLEDLYEQEQSKKSNKQLGSASLKLKLSIERFNIDISFRSASNKVEQEIQTQASFVSEGSVQDTKVNLNNDRNTVQNPQHSLPYEAAPLAQKIDSPQNLQLVSLTWLQRLNIDLNMHVKGFEKGLYPNHKNKLTTRKEKRSDKIFESIGSFEDDGYSYKAYSSSHFSEVEERNIESGSILKGNSDKKMHSLSSMGNSHLRSNSYGTNKLGYCDVKFVDSGFEEQFSSPSQQLKETESPNYKNKSDFGGQAQTSTTEQMLMRMLYIQAMTLQESLQVQI